MSFFILNRQQEEEKLALAAWRKAEVRQNRVRGIVRLLVERHSGQLDQDNQGQQFLVVSPWVTSAGLS
jgi:hypothetical protein